MRRLTLTTALVAAFLPAAAFAQTADPAAPQVEVTVPEGFERQEAMVSAEELLGEKVYDVSGESIGEVGDLVFTMTDTENTGGAEATTATGNGTAAATTPATGETATDGAATAPATGDAATATPEADAATATDTTTAPASDDATATDTATTPADDATATDGATAPATGDAAAAAPEADAATATDTTTAPATGDATAADDTATTTAAATDGGTAMPDTGTADTTATDSGTTGDTAYTAPAPSDNAADSATTAGDAATAPAATVGEVTHVVLDIGGFLGIGEHRVAVPVSDLAFYRNGDDTRVYLPWSREQLEAIPAYNADDPATWATSTLPAEN